MSFLYDPWPWYISGPLIAVIMLMLLLVGKSFGMSSNLRTICTMCGAGGRADFFKFDWKAQKWNLIVLVGAVLGGFIGSHFLSNESAVAIAPATINQLNSLGFDSAGTTYMPTELFDSSALVNIKSLVILISGGLLVGFGARYAGGCTSGHAISGLSNLQLPSLISVVGFFIGGLFMIHVLFPLIF